MTFHIPFEPEDDVERLLNRPNVSEDPADFFRKVSRAAADWKLTLDGGAQRALRRKLSGSDSIVYAGDAEHAANLVAKTLGQHALVRAVMTAEDEGKKFNLADSYLVTKADIKAAFGEASVNDLIDFESEDNYNRENGLLSGAEAVRVFDAYLVKHNLSAEEGVRDAILKSLSRHYYEFRAEDVEEFCYRLSLATLRRAVEEDADINKVTMKDLDALNPAAAQEREEAAQKAVSRLIGGEALGEVLKDVLPKPKR